MQFELKTLGRTAKKPDPKMLQKMNNFIAQNIALQYVLQLYAIGLSGNGFVHFFFNYDFKNPVAVRIAISLDVKYAKKCCCC